MLDIPNPVDTATQGMMNGFNMAASVDKVQQQREQAEAQKQQQAQLNQNLQYLADNPTPENYAKVMTMHPQLSENLKRSYDTMDDGKRKTTLSVASQAYSALMSDNPTVAQQVIEDAATAYENSGNTKDASVLRGYSKLITTNPKAARTSIGMLLASTNPDKVSEIYSTLGKEGRETELQPYAINEIQAKTNKTIAETDDIGENAIDRRSGIGIQQQKADQDNDQFYSKLDQDQQQFYDGLDAKDKTESRKLALVTNENGTKKTERLEKSESFATAARQAADGAVMAANLANDINGLNDGTGSWHDRFFRMVPNTNEYNFAQKFETMKSKIFLAQVDQMRGLGALTEREGDALKTSIASLDLNQDPVIIQKNLTDIARVMSTAAKSASKKAQIYATKGQGYSGDVISAAQELGITPAEAQLFVNQNGL